MTKIKRPNGLRNDWIMGALALAISPAIGTNIAFADEDLELNKSKETIIVTGQKRAENPYADPDADYRVVHSANPLLTEELINTPKSIQVLPEALLEDMAITTMRDLFRTQPGITLATGEGGNAFGDRIFVRGFDARNDVYIDGVRDPGLGSREMFATQQVEIMKGPSSSFGGRGTTGGAVSIISKKPKFSDSTSIETTIGTDQNTRLSIDTNKSINDELAIRLNLMGQKSNVPGRDNVHSNRWGVAIAARYTPIETLDLGFDYYHLSTDYMPDWGLPWDGTRNKVANVDRSNFYGIKSRDFGETFSDVYTLNGTYEISDNLSVRTIARYGQTNNEYRATAPESGNFTDKSINRNGIIQPAWTLAANAKPRFQLTDYLTNQTSLNYKIKTGFVEHTFVTGFELSNENTRMKSYSFTECGVPPCTGAAPRIFMDIFNPDFNYPWTVSGETATGHTAIETKTKAIYGFDNLRIGEKWLAQIGVRHDVYETERNTITYATNIWGVPVTSKSEFTTYQLGLVYKPTKSSSLYASFGSSANPPCEQLDSTGVDYGGCDTSTNAIDPIENESLEIGGKFNIAKHIDVTIAAFDIKRKKVPSVVRVANISTLFLEQQSVNGIEMTASGKVADKLSVSAGFTMFDSNTDKSTNPNSTNVGKPFANVSEMTFTLSTKYELNDKVAFGGTWVSQSEKYGGTYSAGSQKLDGFNRIDLMAEYKIREGLELQFNILNATDETYYDALYRSATPYVYIAPGRSASVMIDWHF